MNNYYQKKRYKDKNILENSFLNTKKQFNLPPMAFRLLGYSETIIEPKGKIKFDKINNIYFSIEYIYSGTGSFIFKNKKTIATAGTIMLGGENRNKVTLVADRDEIIEKRAVMICRNPILEHIFELLNDEEISYINIKKNERVNQLFQKIKENIELGGEFQSKNLSDLCYSIITEINSSRYLENNLDTFSQVVNAICRFPQRYKDVDTMIRELKISRSCLFRLFKKNFDTSPMNFIIRQKIYNSLWYLSNQDISINYLSDFYGYNNPNFFTRQFKQIMGISPSEYRKQHQNLKFQESKTSK